VDATDRETARRVMVNLGAMRALVEAALAGNDLDAHDWIALCREEFNAGHGCVNVKTGAIEYARGVRPMLGTGVFRSIIR